MKNSHIFWNVMILIAEIIIGLIMFGFEPELLTYLGVIWGGFHSLGLFADIADGGTFNDHEDFFPAFLFVSALGIICLVIIGIAFLIIKIGESRWNPVKHITNPIVRFNNWLDRKK